MLGSTAEHLSIAQCGSTTELDSTVELDGNVELDSNVELDGNVELDSTQGIPDRGGRNKKRKSGELDKLHP